ncbi:MAG: DUF2202 domain-containing protein [Epsilonproteobacteria bacterium]|nr:DUF2202 domain-containing protein [Campylobacterota bacterium]
MKKKLMVLAVLPIIFTGCLSQGQGRGMGGGYGNGGGQGGYQVPSATQTYNISPTLKESIAHMYDEERLAHDVYLAIYQKQPVFQLERIATRSEARHIQAVEDLAKKYGVRTYYHTPGRYANSHIQSLYNTLYRKGIRSQRDALEVGCMVEVTDIDDLNRYIAEAEREGASDVVSVYDFLRRGSYNHYWAFDRGLKQLGVSNGCCSLGEKYCHPEYPKNQKGGYGRGRGHGQGMGMGRGRW